MGYPPPLLFPKKLNKWMMNGAAEVTTGIMSLERGKDLRLSYEDIALRSTHNSLLLPQLI